MFQVEFAIENMGKENSDYNLGDIFVTGTNGFASSKGRSVMILPSITLLLDQLRTFMVSGGARLEFVGVDSSFKIAFEKMPKNIIQVGTSSLVIDQVPPKLLADAIWTGANLFLLNNDEVLRQCLLVEDVVAAMQAFKTAFKNVSAGDSSGK